MAQILLGTTLENSPSEFMRKMGEHDMTQWRAVMSRIGILGA
jgi:hypothetical protein